MRILIVTQNFYPEFFKSNDIAFELANRGYEVEVLTGIPNYPEGVFYEGYGIFKKRKQVVNGVKIYRAYNIPRGKKASKVKLFLNYLSFALNASVYALWFSIFKKRYDAIFVQQTSPIMQAIPAVLLGRIRRIPVYTWVLDIWPDSALSVIKGKEPRFLNKVLTSITEYVYRNSYRILISSKGMEALVNRNHDYGEKIIYFPNWCDDILSFPKKESLKLPEGFKIMMAGNLGLGMGVDAVIDLVTEFKDDDRIQFVFVGGGSKEDYLRNQFSERELTNVTMTGRLPFDQMPALYAQADAMLLTLVKTEMPHLNATVPARLQSYMAAGKPIIAMVGGCSQDVIKAAGCGYYADANGFKEVAEKIRIMSLLPKSELERMSVNSRNYFEKYYQMQGCLDNLEHYLRYSNSSNVTPYPVPDV